jgi:acetyl/propionyl-CoA carboxylase alpha subunit
VKAAAGGGGKGFRVALSPAGLEDAFEGSRREGERFFADGTVYLERYLPEPRHVEIQILADEHGSCIWLGERDCSVQRRHQKLVEETPSPVVDDALRRRMGEASVRAAQAVGYRSAGTLEYLVSGGEFFFLEMNTRIQVEHTVTEMVCGIDLVREQIRVAAGEPLSLAQEDVAPRGHAFECRINAEDASARFLPSPALITAYREPSGPGIRVDSGVRAGSEIPEIYDPMIAKLIAWGPTRAVALGRLAHALDATRVAGCTTNLGFLARLARQRDFAAGRVDTGLIERDLDALTVPRPPSPDVLAVAALAAGGLLDRREPLAGFTLWAPLRRSLRLEAAGAVHAVGVETLGPGRFVVDGRSVAVTAWQGGELAVAIDGRARRFGVALAGDAVTVFEGAEAHPFRVPDPLAAGAEAHGGGDEIRAPMPGLVKELAAAPGAMVARGDVLVVLEAMKMEHALTAPRDGRIGEVLVEAGAQVTDGTLLLALEPEDE